MQEKPATGHRQPATGNHVRPGERAHTPELEPPEQATGHRPPEAGNGSRPEDLRRGADIALRCLALAADVLKVTRVVRKDFAGKHVCTQLIRSATSAGANYEEARAAESKSDFIHKLAIASKEARETIYWLRLLDAAGMASVGIAELVTKAIELCAIFGASIKTARASSERTTREPPAF